MKQVTIGDEVLYVSYIGPERKAVVENIEICRPGEKYGNCVISCDLDRHQGVVTLNNHHWCYFDQIIKVTKSGKKYSDMGNSNNDIMKK